MFFFGKVNIGQSLSSLQKRRDRVAEIRLELASDIVKAVEARQTVIATAGEEIAELKKLYA